MTRASIRSSRPSRRSRRHAFQSRGRYRRRLLVDDKRRNTRYAAKAMLLYPRACGPSAFAIVRGSSQKRPIGSFTGVRFTGASCLHSAPLLLPQPDRPTTRGLEDDRQVKEGGSIPIDRCTSDKCAAAIIRCNQVPAFGEQKRHNGAPRAKYWEIIADNLSKAGWSWGCASTADSNGRTIFIADAHCSDGKRFIVRADEKLTAFLELESAIRAVRIPSCQP